MSTRSFSMAPNDHFFDCALRRAMRRAAGVECEHGWDVCPHCDPCTCKQIIAAGGPAPEPEED